MKKFVLVFFFLGVFVLSSRSQVMAIDGYETPLKDKREEVREVRQEKREVRVENRQEKREEIRENRKERREEFKDKIEARREEIKAKIEERREALKEKLKEFKDKKKAQIAERVSNNLNKINDNRVDAMTKHLEQIEELLGKVEERIAGAKADGKDVDAIETAITNAEGAITTARGALATQASKDYTLVATDEEGIRSEAQAKRESLHNDLKGVHELVVAARKAVSDVIKTAYGSLGKENIDNEEE